MNHRSSAAEPNLPWFKFFARDFLADQNVILMSQAERGLDVSLKSSFWLAGSLPADPVRLARLCHASHDEFRELWPAVERYFEQRGDRLFHTALEEQRNEAIAVFRALSEGGRKGAERRWGGLRVG